MSAPFGPQNFENAEPVQMDGLWAAYVGRAALADAPPQTRTILHLDFETYSEVNLKDAGASVYARHPSTEVLMLAYATRNSEIKQWVPAHGEPMPDDLRRALADPGVTVAAWNAPFEMAIMEHVLGIRVPRERWLDVMALSYTLALPGSLEKCGEVIGLGEDKKKSARGKTLIRKFCQPRKPSKHKPWTRSTRETDPEEWEEFLGYNRQDVEAERAIYRRIKKWMMPDDEWAMWHLDQKINDAGIPVNLNAVRAAVRILEATVAKDLAEMRALTGLANPNSGAQLLPWLRDRGYLYGDLKKGHVARAAEWVRECMEDDTADLLGLDATLLRVLELRLRVSKASVKKYPALLKATDADGNLRGCHQFAGAARTWRWSGRRFQPQNLSKPSKSMEKFILAMAPTHNEDGNKLSGTERAKIGFGILVHDVEHLSVEEFWAKYESDDPEVNTMEALVAAVRPMVQAPQGYELADADLSAIENVVLGWLAQDEKILRVFREGLDPYIDFATDMFNMSYSEIEAEVEAGDKSKRTTAKPGVLGCFGPDTPVLTDRGWVRIVEIRDTDKLFDGEEWVSHDGVVFQGRKEVIEHRGLIVTPDHRVRAYRGALGVEWVGAITWAAGLSSNGAHDLANGKFSIAAGAVAKQERFIDAVARVEWNRTSERGTSSTTRPGCATLAPRKTVAERLESGSGLGSTICSQIVSTLREAGAKTRTTRLTSITGVGEFVCGSGAPISGSNTWSMSSEQTEASKSTGSTTTEITSRATFDSQHDQVRTGTSETWDILNTGDRNRFVVLTEDGPLVVHNCGYMLGAGQVFENSQTGELEGTGLLGYAWGMGVDLTPEMSKLSVDTFRSKFEAVKAFWYDLERAAIRTVRTKKPHTVGYLKFDISGPFLRMHLPSGRCLHYWRPKVQTKMMPWGKEKLQLSYEQIENGQWRRVSTHPGKLTENAVQAVARDLLAHAMMLADRAGLDLRMHVHDQAVALVAVRAARSALKTLIRCLTTLPPWADETLPLKAAGFTSPIFLKD